jgi:hypothetical protein
MEATYSFETSADFQQTTWHYIAEDRIIQRARHFLLAGMKKRFIQKGGYSFGLLLAISSYL